jgi:ketosteroid isomerase-like protein
MSIENDVRRLLDLEAIRNLARRYAHYVWSGDVPAATNLFAEDGVMDTGTEAPIRGRQALLETYTRMLGPSIFHPYVHNHVINLDGDRASGVCYLDLRAVVDGKSLIGGGYYHDEYVRCTEDWKFQSRKLHMSYLVTVTEGWAGQTG